MQHLEVSGAVRPLYGSLGVKELIQPTSISHAQFSIILPSTVRSNKRTPS